MLFQCVSKRKAPQELYSNMPKDTWIYVFFGGIIGPSLGSFFVFGWGFPSYPSGIRRDKYWKIVPKDTWIRPIFWNQNHRHCIAIVATRTVRSAPLLVKASKVFGTASATNSTTIEPWVSWVELWKKMSNKVTIPSKWSIYLHEVGLIFLVKVNYASHGSYGCEIRYWSIVENGWVTSEICFKIWMVFDQISSKKHLSSEQASEKNPPWEPTTLQF